MICATCWEKSEQIYPFHRQSGFPWWTRFDEILGEQNIPEINSIATSCFKRILSFLKSKERSSPHSSIQKLTLTRGQRQPSTNICTPPWRLKWFPTPHASAEPGRRGSNPEPRSDPHERFLEDGFLPWKKPTSKWQNTTNSYKFTK